MDLARCAPLAFYHIGRGSARLVSLTFQSELQITKNLSGMCFILLIYGQPEQLVEMQR